MLKNLPQAAIIAHRGASAYAPENTLSAFKLALQQGADAIELDTKLTADGQVIVIHDQTVDRTTPYSGQVKEFTLSEIRKLDAGSHFDITFRGEKIPTLEDVLQTVGQLTYLNIELTNYSSIFDELPQKVALLVKKYELTQRVIFSSFSFINLLRIRGLIPDASIGLLAHPGWKGFLVRSGLGLWLDYQSLHIHAHDATPQLIEEIHRKNRKVFVYTINQEKDIKTTLQMEVDAIFTDDPLLARRVIINSGISQSYKQS